jgi:hypothetical protein
VHQSGTQIATINISFRCRYHEIDIRSRINPTCRVIRGLERVLDRRHAAAYCIVPRSQPFHPFSLVPLAHFANVLFVAVNWKFSNYSLNSKIALGPQEVGQNWRKSPSICLFCSKFWRSPIISGNVESILRPKKPGTRHRAH